MLTVQYRMHPEIRVFPSDYFYQGLLRDSPQIVQEVTARRNGSNSSDSITTYVTSPLIDRIGLSPVLFINMRGREVRTGTSYTNEDEARRLVETLQALNQRGVFSEESVGVLTPYKAQVRLLQRKLRDLKYSSSTTSSTNTVIKLDEVVEVNSIDGFQGRERDVILFSTVRCTTNGSNSHSARAQIGFVADERRLNVAITRARKLLLIFGHADTLSIDPGWKALLQSLERRGLVKEQLTL
jgi:senataxin